MYNAGMGETRPKPGQEADPLFPVKSPHLKPLGLNAQDLSDLRALLESLTERRRRVRVPGQS
jgi:cytochrome c peroxidase